MKPYCITIIGAESTGKTTLSRQLADKLEGDWVCEFARPYLETTSYPISRESMTNIFQGQCALQYAANQSPRSYVVQDTDLYATIGYWQLPHVTPKIGKLPPEIEQLASNLASDLYIVTPSSIPFEPDQLRYGKDKRESPDNYWVDLCEKYKLPYVVVKSTSPEARLTESLKIIKERSLHARSSNR